MPEQVRGKSCDMFVAAVELNGQERFVIGVEDGLTGNKASYMLPAEDLAQALAEWNERQRGEAPV